MLPYDAGTLHVIRLPKLSPQVPTEPVLVTSGARDSTLVNGPGSFLVKWMQGVKKKSGVAGDPVLTLL